MKTVQMRIDGMTCGHCKKGVESALQNAQGVEVVRVDLELGAATIILSTSVDPKLLVEAVEDEGYDATLLSVTDDSSSQPPQ